MINAFSYDLINFPSPCPTQQW